MKPTLAEYYESKATWRIKYKGIYGEVQHHAINDYTPEGIYCSYITLYEDQFAPEIFNKFVLEAIPYQIIKGEGSWHRRYDYYNLPDYGFHGGITYYEIGTYFDSADGKEKKFVKMGCDYSHLWNHERGHQETLNIVKHDLMGVIDKFIEANPIIEAAK